MYAMKKIYAFLLMMFSVVAMAQTPKLEIPNTKGDFKPTNEVNLDKLDIQVKIAGNISTTIMTMVFRSNATRILEGRLTFPLLEGVSVSGYALDINGKLRNAVPVEKEKAKEVFESIEKRRVDPGILEKVEGNNFRTRIYPIMPNSTRTVQITYHQELKKSGGNLQYFLPLDLEKAIPEFKLKTSVFENFTTPQLEEKPNGEFDFVKNGNVWIAETKKINYKTTGNLKVNLPQSDDKNAVVMQNASGGNFYFLANVNINASSRAKNLPSKIGLIWDNSLSAKKANHEKEFELLDEYFKAVQNISVKIAYLNNDFEEGKVYTIKNGNWDNLKTELKSVKYDGGTDFGKLKNLENVGEYLIFSDGISSFGDLNLRLNKPVYTVVSSAKANFSQLKFISLKTGGELLNLTQSSAKSEVKKLLYQNLKFLGIKENRTVSEVYPTLAQTVENGFNISGISSRKNNEITLLFGFGNTPTIEKVVKLNADENTVEDWEIAQFWAQKKIAELELFADKNKDDIKNLGKQFGIVTMNSSLIVLENVSDYVKYEITPPSELKTEYDNQMKNVLAQRENRVNNLMQRAESMTENLKTWWKTDFTPKKKYPEPTSKRDSVRTRGISENTSRRNRERRNTRTDTTKSKEIEEVVMVGYGTQRKTDITASATQALEGRASGVAVNAMEIKREDKNLDDSYQPNSGKITVVDIKSDAEYMNVFDKISSAEGIYNEYLVQREKYLQTPSFYFDVAQLLFEKNNPKLAMRVLSSIADLDLENEELYKLLAYKLKETKFYDKELWIFGKVLEWRPFDPQSYRDYALALEDNGKHQEALDTIYKIFNRSYTQELADRDFGIEETVLMELNEMISRHKNELDLSKINEKLIADLPVDVRVALNWNKDNTDIDLWVTDPNGEKCMYSHKSTEIGGRLSDDFTGGFGPEQFLLKKAIKGTYKIETNFYGENQVSVSGPTSLMAEIFINYASGKQERQIVVFNKSKKSSTGNGDGILIAEFKF